jgi:hypothetical protein
MGKARQDMVEIKTVNRKKQSSCHSGREIQNKNRSARAKHTVHFKDRQFPIRHVPQTESHCYDIENAT